MGMWWSYEDVKEQKARVQREIAKRVKRGEKFEVLPAPAGRTKLSATFWGQAWHKNLESYQVYESRLPRGRSYLRQGNVYNLDISAGKLSAVVAGSELYDTHIHIKPLPQSQWKEIVGQGSGEVGSMLDLLAGRLGDGLMRLLTHPERGLFPKPVEIRFDCSCPDFADMCKHVSAVLYGVGVLLDTKPELLFTLRGVDQAELLADASSAAITGVSTGAGDDLAGADLSALFGIDLGGDASVPGSVAEPEPARPEPPSVKAPAAKRPTRVRGISREGLRKAKAAMQERMEKLKEAQSGNDQKPAAKTTKKRKAATRDIAMTNLRTGETKVIQVPKRKARKSKPAPKEKVMRNPKTGETKIIPSSKPKKRKQ